MSNIRLLKRAAVDIEKWDNAILNAHNSLPYALSYYLDAVAEHWDALVLNDYEAVMPLVWLRKLGIKCLYQPYYCQQLGVFSRKPISADVYKQMLEMGKAGFPYIQINLNASADVIRGDFKLIPKTNLLLPLEKPYEELAKKFAGNNKRNIASAIKSGLVLGDYTNLKTFQQFYLSNINHDKENVQSKHEKIFKKLTQTLYNNKTGFIYAATRDGELMAAAFIVQHQNRLIGIINTSSAAGKKTGASHFVFDQIIKKYAGTRFTLDFEGSSIPGIARFYAGFGATEEVFYCYKSNLLKAISQRFK